MVRLTKHEKNKIVSGSAWSVVLMFSLIVNAIIGIAETAISGISATNPELTSNLNKGYYSPSSQKLYLSVSKYPSQTKLKFGLPWM